MKDFIFTDAHDSQAKVIFRTDLIGSGENFTVHQIIGLDEDEIYAAQGKKKKLLAYKQLPYTKAAFTAFALANGLNLVMQDGNGENSTTLVDYDSDYSDASW